MRQILPIILIVLLGCAAVSEAPSADPSSFELACQAMEVNCSGVAPPIVVTSAIVDQIPCFGCEFNGMAFNGEPYIFINAYASPQQQTWTEFHETIHYIVHMTRMEISRCENEELARKLTALQFNFQYDPEWLPRYGCNADGTDTPPPELPEAITKIIQIVKGE